VVKIYKRKAQKKVKTSSGGEPQHILKAKNKIWGGSILRRGGVKKRGETTSRKKKARKGEKSKRK